MSTTSERRRGRELTLQACYAFELSGNRLEVTLEDVILSKDLSPSILDFSQKLFRKICENRETFDSYIKRKAVNWEFSRIAIIDKLILRMAICEFLYFPDIPPKVSIDEAIEIAKKFSTEKSGKFVNGILDAVLLDLRESGRLQKSGRGLSEGSDRQH